MSPVPALPRALDHLVLPVIDLVTARQRLSRLGFTVAADARHPFGTENACVFFRDDTYLEPLAVGSREDCLAAVRAGNVFVARDQAFRFRRGEGSRQSSSRPMTPEQIMRALCRRFEWW